MSRASDARRDKAVEEAVAGLAGRAMDPNKRKAEIDAAKRELMAKPGSLGLPELLEERRWKYLIPDGAFQIQASFERILVWSIPPAEQQAMYSTSKFIMPDAASDRLQAGSPWGVIVSAGAAALDALRTNGMDVGHEVLYTHYIIGKTPIDYFEGKDRFIEIMKTGDISGSRDTARLMREGKLRIGWNEETKQHYYIWGPSTEGDPAFPVLPWITRDI